jgi:hypothetical protein
MLLVFTRGATLPCWRVRFTVKVKVEGGYEKSDTVRLRRK